MYVPDETVHSSFTDLTQASTHLVVILSCCNQNTEEQYRRGDNKFVKLKGTFQSDQKDQSKGTIPHLNILAGQTKMVHFI